jgi:ribosomal protein S18 acetylase RimI-like enzyme
MATGAITVRRARADDIAGVLAIDHIDGRADEIRHAIQCGRCLIAEDGAGIVGFCVDGRLFAFAFLELLVVAPSHSRRGVGTLLVKAWEESAATAKVFTSTNASNIPMQRLCEGLGYARTGLIENLDEGDPEFFYSKRL